MYIVYTKKELVAQLHDKEQAIKRAQHTAKVSRDHCAYVYKDGLLIYAITNES